MEVAIEDQYFCFYSGSCYGFFPPLEMTSTVDVVVVVVVDVVVGSVGRP